MILRPDGGGPSLTRLGSDYGGWQVPLDLLDKYSVCYLAGVGTDITFDLSLLERVGCRAWGIDPTPKTIDWIAGQDIDPRYTFVPIGLAGEAGELRFFSPENPDHVSHSIKNLQGTKTYFTAEVTTVGGLMSRLGHDELDLLKLDIEGAEHDTIRAMLGEGIRPRVLCVEFDQPEPLAWARDTTAALRGAGYRLVRVDGFNVTFVNM
jgi:FkbM family methyltransferase